MSPSDNLTTEIIGYVASSMTFISLIPQLAKIVVNNSAKDVSLESYFIFIVVEALWLYYGVKTMNYQIIMCNATCIIISSSIIILGFVYNSNLEKKKLEESNTNSQQFTV